MRLRLHKMILLEMAGALVRSMLEAGAQVPLMLVMRGEERVRKRTMSIGVRLPPRRSANSTTTPHLRRQPSQRGRAIRSPRRRLQQPQPPKRPHLRLLLSRSRASQHTSAHPLQ